MLKILIKIFKKRDRSKSEINLKQKIRKNFRLKDKIFLYYAYSWNQLYVLYTSILIKANPP